MECKTDTLVTNTKHTSCDCLGVLNWSFSEMFKIFASFFHIVPFKEEPFGVYVIVQLCSSIFQQVRFSPGRNRSEIDVDDKS